MGGATGPAPPRGCSTGSGGAEGARAAPAWALAPSSGSCSPPAPASCSPAPAASHVSGAAAPEAAAPHCGTAPAVPAPHPRAAPATRAAHCSPVLPGIPHSPPGIPCHPPGHRSASSPRSPPDTGHPGLPRAPLGPAPPQPPHRRHRTRPKAPGCPGAPSGAPGTLPAAPHPRARCGPVSGRPGGRGRSRGTRSGSASTSVSAAAPGLHRAWPRFPGREGLGGGCLRRGKRSWHPRAALCGPWPLPPGRGDAGTRWLQEMETGDDAGRG